MPRVRRYELRQHARDDLEQALAGRADAIVRRLEQMPETCALDVADLGGTHLETIGDLIGVTRERIRQIEDRALARLRVPEVLDQVEPPDERPAGPWDLLGW